MDVHHGEVKVFYKLSEENRSIEMLDTDLREFFKSRGYKATQSGYDLVKNVRDMSFEKEGEV